MNGTIQNDRSVPVQLVAMLRPRVQGFARISLIVVAIALGAGIAVYFTRSQPHATGYAEVDEWSTAREMVTSTETASKPAGSIASLVEGLAARLENEADDGKGWLLLAKSYNHLGRLREARDAYAKALSLGQIDGDLAASLASERLQIALDTEIRGHISISQQASLQVSGSDTVFITAKSIAGSQMPVAVLRKSVSDLPFDFVMNDATSMLPASRLSNVTEVTISARVSRSGDALQSIDGLGAQSEPVRTQGDEPVTLEIDVTHGPGEGRRDNTEI